MDRRTDGDRLLSEGRPGCGAPTSEGSFGVAGSARPGRTWPERTAAAVLAIVALVGCTACGDGGARAGERRAGSADESQAAGPSAPPAQNLILITIDTLRADALGFAGNEEVETPTLDRLAAAGRVYTEAHAHNVVTLPSHTNILTGRYPYEHGVRNNGGFELGPELPTLASLLHAAGFATGAVVGAFPLDGSFGLDRGFDLYDDDFDEARGDHLFVYAQRSGDEVVSRGLAWWRQNSGHQRFLWLHLFEPHAPYTPPAPFADRISSPYLGEVSAVDRELRPLLEPFLAGTEQPTVIAVTADHGNRWASTARRPMACSPTRRPCTFRFSSGGRASLRDATAALPATST